MTLLPEIPLGIGPSARRFARNHHG
jgi:hypothetical protein